mgnify:FL=1
MDLRTKLIFALVLTSLVSTALLGLFSFQASYNMLRELTGQRLDALANTRDEDFELVGEAWREALQQIRSRTELREQLAGYDGDPEAARAKIDRIVEDAVAAADAIEHIAVFTLDRTLVAEAGDVELGPASNAIELDSAGTLSFNRSREAGEIGFYTVLNSPLLVAGQRVGYMESVLDIGDTLELARDYRGLGETGETLLVVEITPGILTVLNGSRHLEELT